MNCGHTRVGTCVAMIPTAVRGASGCGSAHPCVCVCMPAGATPGPSSSLCGIPRVLREPQGGVARDSSGGTCGLCMSPEPCPNTCVQSEGDWGTLSSSAVPVWPVVPGLSVGVNEAGALWGHRAGQGRKLTGSSLPCQLSPQNFWGGPTHPQVSMCSCLWGLAWSLQSCIGS